MMDRMMLAAIAMLIYAIIDGALVDWLYDYWMRR